MLVQHGPQKKMVPGRQSFPFGNGILGKGHDHVPYTASQPWPYPNLTDLRKLKEEHATLDDKAEVVLNEYNKLQLA